MIHISVPAWHLYSVRRTVYWKERAVANVHGFFPKRRVRKAHLLLIISTTYYDSVRPLAATRSPNAAFEDSQIIEVMDYGHGVPADPSKCTLIHFREYLDDGTLPAEYTRCEVDDPPIVKPTETGELLVSGHDDDP